MRDLMLTLAIVHEAFLCDTGHIIQIM